MNGEVFSNMKQHGKSINVDNERPWLRVYSDGKSTIAEVIVWADGHEYRGSGSSRRVKGDAYDARTGNLLAIFRAVDDVRGQLKKEVDKIH